MSKTINALQQELSELNGKMHDAHAKNELEREAVQSLHDKVRSKDLVIGDLNQQLDNANESIHNAAKESCESKSRVETIESQFTSYKEEKETQVNKLQQDLVKAESENASLSEQLATLSDKLESKVALLCKSTAELLDESRKDSNAQIDARSTLLGISTRSQQTHEVLLQVKEQQQVDIDEILRTIRSTMSEELQVMHAMLEEKLVPTKPSSDAFDGQNDEPEHRATAFVQNILSEAFETTICT
jgi:chromosome segregation ATPase